MMASLESQAIENNSPLETLMKDEARGTIRAGLARLSRLDRETLTAFYLRGQSIREMSEAQDAPEGTRASSVVCTSLVTD